MNLQQMYILVNGLDEYRFERQLVDQTNPAVGDRMCTLRQLKMNVARREHGLAGVVWNSPVESLLNAPPACLDLFWYDRLEDLRALGRRSVAKLENTKKRYKHGGPLLYFERWRKSPLQARLLKG